MITADDEVSLAYLISPTFQVENTEGRPLTGGYIEVYIHGTRTKYYCYSDWNGSLHPFKIPLDSLGSNIVLASPAHSYDIYIYNKYGTLVMSRYNIIPATGDGAVIKDVVNITSNDGTVNIASQDKVNWDLSIKDTVAGIESALSNKKDKQPTKNFTGSATKTIKNISQNANGELTVEFEDIAGGSGGQINVAHDATMTGDGTNEMPLSIQASLDISNANTAPKYDPNAIYPTVGTLCTYGNVLYRSKVAINKAEHWTGEHWQVDSVASELEELKAPPIWEDITSKLGNYYGTDTREGDQHIVINYSRKLAMLQFGGYVMPTVGGNAVKIFTFNNDIVMFSSAEYYTKSGRYVLYVSLTPYDVNTDFRKAYSITARDVTAKQNIEFQFFCPLMISVNEFEAYLNSH